MSREITGRSGHLRFRSCFDTCLDKGLYALLMLCLCGALSAQPTPTGGEIGVNGVTMGEQDTAEVAVDAHGGAVVVFESGRDGSLDGIALRRLDRFGVPIGDEVLVNSETMGDQADPALALAEDGSFVVVWDSDGQDGDLRGVYGQRFDATGAPADDEFRLNPLAMGDQNDAVVAPLPGGGFVAVWENEVAVSGTDEDLVARIYDADGLPGTEFPVSTTLPLDQEDAAVAADALGRFVVVWESEGQDGSFDGIVARRFAADGTPLSDELDVNTTTTGDQRDPAVSMLPDGRFVVVWEDDWVDLAGTAIVARFYGADGQAATGEVRVDCGCFGSQLAPRVVMEPDGGALFVWDSPGRDGSSIAIVLSRFDSSGLRVGGEEVVNTSTTGPQVRPVVARGGSHYLVVWQDEAGLDGSTDGVFAQRLTQFLFTDGFEGGNSDAWTTVVTP